MTETAPTAVARERGQPASLTVSGVAGLGHARALRPGGQEALSLDPGEVHLWLADPGRFQDPSLLERWEATLSAAERRRRARFVFPRHRHDFLVSHGLTRATLSRYDGVDPAAWAFSHNEYGRPEVANKDARWLRFNLSHTEGLCVVAVTRELDIGVDVEEMHGKTPSIEIAERFFAPIEVENLRALSPRHRPDRFFSYWTLKEAYIKARGAGLSLPLDLFAFTLQPDGLPRISFDPQLADDPDAWHFGLFRPTPRHRLAFALRFPRAPAISVYEIVPIGP
jgi:4'-phosphopantetheinyl transferase